MHALRCNGAVPADQRGLDPVIQRPVDRIHGPNIVEHVERGPAAEHQRRGQGEAGAFIINITQCALCFCHIPGLKVVAPSTPYDAKGLLISSIEDDNPVIFMEQKLLYRTKGMVPQEMYRIPIGKADIKRSGSDVTIITYGRMVKMCLDSAEKLAAEGISVEVIDLRTLRPLDKDTIIESVSRTSRAIIVHEACLTGGLGGEISSIISESDAFFHLDAPIMRVCGADIPIPYNPILEKNAVPTPEKIESAVRKAMAL